MLCWWVTRLGFLSISLWKDTGHLGGDIGHSRESAASFSTVILLLSRRHWRRMRKVKVETVPPCLEARQYEGFTISLGEESSRNLQACLMTQGLFLPCTQYVRSYSYCQVDRLLLKLRYYEWKKLRIYSKFSVSVKGLCLKMWCEN